MYFDNSVDIRVDHLPTMIKSLFRAGTFSMMMILFSYTSTCKIQIVISHIEFGLDRQSNLLYLASSV